MSKTNYKPGVSNIGKNEMKKRVPAILIGFSLVIALIYILPTYNLFIPVSMSILFFPFLLGFEGLFQYVWKFSPGLAKKKLYDFSGTSDEVGKVKKDEDHYHDMQTSMKLHMYSIFASLILTAIIFGFFYVPNLIAITPADNATTSIRIFFSLINLI